MKLAPQTDSFSRLVQFTGYILLVALFPFWAVTDRISVELIGVGTTLLVYDAGRNALRNLAKGHE